MAAAKKIYDFEGEGAVNERKAQWWFKRFVSGNSSLEDEQHPGRPQIWDSEATKEAVEQQPSTSTHRLSGTFGPSRSIIHRHLTSLGQIYRSCRVVPHELTVERGQRRAKFCRKLLQLLKDHRFIKRIITCNKKWIYLNNLNPQKQWLYKGQLPVPVTKRECFEKKGPPLHLVELRRSYLLRTCARGPYDQRGGILSAEKMYTVLLEKYKTLVNRKRVLLQQDNAHPHTVKTNLQKIEELEGSELLLHLAFSSDLEPSDYYLFHCMAQFLHGKKFQSVADVEVAVEEFFASKDKEWFCQAFKELAEKWVKTIEHEGLYFEY
jgi:hypothetical protein